MSDRFVVMVIKDACGQLYHLRMDKPFERPLSKLMTALAQENKQETPRTIAMVWAEDMTEIEYEEIDKALLPAKLPSFVTTEEP